jgi:RNA polymerase sigma-70 factor (ECF subfamily)
MTLNEYNCCVDSHADGVYRFILKNLKDAEDARDVVQDAFEKLWRNRHAVGAGKGKSYLFTTAYHTMIDLIRKKQHNRQMEDLPEPAGRDTGTYNDLKEVLDEALGRLSEVQRSVVLLRDYEGYSYREIGEITGLNESQVKVYIYRARTFLKNYIVNPELVI